MRIAVKATVVVLALWLAGLLAFVTAIPRERTPLAAPADGVVVLTGGMDRLNAGMALLTAGKAKRLLISGVHPDTTRQDILERIDDPKELFDCCVDVDRAALDTRGNAAETARWVDRHDFQTVIVVTAHYHMPRSMQAYRRALPDTELIAYPVFPDGVDVNRWWIDPGTGRLIVAEYIKFVLGLVEFPG